jgi:hypothetical protein
MTKTYSLVLMLALSTAHASAQPYEVLGTRAAGMGGAFVAVGDDASAIYWNPAALATGSFFSFVVDYGTAEALPEGRTRAGSQSASFIGLGVPALGIGYYRLRATTVGPAPVPADRLDAPRDLDGQGVRVASLVTHHVGVTLVQSLTDNIAVGTTLKYVRGTAASAYAPLEPADDVLERADDLNGEDGHSFDADIGAVAVFGTLRLGVAVRNVAEAEFDTPGELDTLRLDRQARAGMALTIATGVVVSADMDILKVPGLTGEVRNFALGGEARVFRRAFVRGGYRFNTLDDQPDGRTPVGTVGGSFAVTSSLFVEGQATFGSDEASRGWGIAGRFLF